MLPLCLCFYISVLVDYQSTYKLYKSTDPHLLGLLLLTLSHHLLQLDWIFLDHQLDWIFLDHHLLLKTRQNPNTMLGWHNGHVNHVNKPIIMIYIIKQMRTMIWALSLILLILDHLIHSQVFYHHMFYWSIMLPGDDIF